MRRPLVGLCLFYAGGIFFSWYLGLTFLHFHYLYPFLVLLFPAAVFFFLKDKPSLSNIFIYISLLLLGMSAYSLRVHPVHPQHIAHLLQGKEEKEVTLEGTVIKDPAVRAGERVTLVLQAERIKREEKWEKVAGLVQISVQGKETVVDYGERIKIVGASLRKPPLPRNPGEFNYRRHLARQGIYALMNVRHRGQIEVLGKGKVNPFLGLALSIKDRMEEIIEDTLEYPQTVLLKGILLGERRGIPENLREIFTRTGTVHILAISGLHVGLVVVTFFVLFQALRIPRKIRALLTMAILGTYVLITGGRPPVIRASIMAAAVLSGMIVNRESDLLNSLSLAALVILALNPQELFSPGFQLSFAAVLSIISLAPRLNNFFLKDASSDSTFKNYLLKSFSVILAAQMGVIPLIAYYFSLFTPIAFLANFLIIPLLGLVVALGFSTCLSGLIFLPLAQLFGAANGVILTVIVESANLLSRFPFAFIYTGRPPLAVILGYYFLIGAILYAQDSRAKK